MNFINRNLQLIKINGIIKDPDHLVEVVESYRPSLGPESLDGIEPIILSGIRRTKDLKPIASEGQLFPTSVTSTKYKELSSGLVLQIADVVGRIVIPELEWVSTSNPTVNFTRQADIKDIPDYYIFNTTPTFRSIMSD